MRQSFLRYATKSIILKNTLINNFWSLEDTLKKGQSLGGNIANHVSEKALLSVT